MKQKDVTSQVLVESADHFLTHGLWLKNKFLCVFIPLFVVFATTYIINSRNIYEVSIKW